MPREPRQDQDLTFDEEKAFAASIERYEKQRRMLAELSQIARDMAKSFEANAKARVRAGGVSGEPGFDLAASLAKLAKSIRLNDALDAKLARSAREATRRHHARILARAPRAGATLN